MLNSCAKLIVPSIHTKIVICWYKTHSILDETDQQRIFSSSKENNCIIIIVSRCDQEIPQSQTADKPMPLWRRDKQPSRDTRKTNKQNDRHSLFAIKMFASYAKLWEQFILGVYLPFSKHHGGLFNVFKLITITWFLSKVINYIQLLCPI